METQLLEHNIITYNKLKEYIDNKQDCCVVNPCGSGKSSIIASVVSDYRDKQILVITKQRNAAAYYYEKCPAFYEHKIPVITYNTLYNTYKNNEIHQFANIDICIIDEAHYMGAEKWSKAFKDLKTTSSCIFVGVTATPQRFKDQGTDKTIIDMFSGNSVGNFTTKQLQQKGVFIEPEYIVSLASLDTEITNRIQSIEESDLSDSVKKRYIQRLNQVYDIWNKECCPELIIKNVLPNYLYKSAGNKILVFSKNVESMKADEDYIMSMLKKQFKGRKIASYEYSYRTSEKELHKFMHDDNHYINVLFSVNKVCETIHISDLNVLIFLRSSMSDRIITQQIGRINDVNNKNKSLIIDMVDNLSKYGKYTVNLAGGNPETANTKNRTTSITYNFNFVRKMVHVFDEIDKSTSQFCSYTYHDITGSIKQLCRIFRKNPDTVHSLLEQGYDIDDAMNLTDDGMQLKVINSDILDGYYERPETFILSEAAKDLIEKYHPVVVQIANSKNCYDEDIISETDLYLCEIAQSYVEHKANGYESTYFRTKLLDYILKLLRDKNDRNDLYSDRSIYSVKTNTKDELTGGIMKQDLHDTVDAVLGKLTWQQQKIMLRRYGFVSKEPWTLDEIGREFCVTSTRIRQIEQKSLHKLRHPVISRELDGYLSLFN